MYASIDTLKQAAQALREYARVQKGEKLLIPAAEDAHALAAALEAMAEQKPVARMVMEDDYWSRGHFYKGTRKKLKLMPDSHDLPCGAELYAAPIATPEHDAKVSGLPRWPDESTGLPARTPDETTIEYVQRCVRSARNEGLEEAAKVCEARMRNTCMNNISRAMDAEDSACAHEIRALKSTGADHAK